MTKSGGLSFFAGFSLLLIDESGLRGRERQSVAAFGVVREGTELVTLHEVPVAGIAQLARASAFQAEGRGFESRFPLQMPA